MEEKIVDSNDDYKYKLAKIFSNFIVEFVKELFAGMCISYH